MQSEGFKNIGIGAAVLLIGITINRYLKKRDEKDTQGTDAFQEEAVKNISVNAKNITKDSFYYKNIAEQCYNELSKRILLTNIFTYNSQTLFGYLQGLNSDELKLVMKEFGVRSLKLFNLIDMPDGGTLLEWFDNILTQEHLDKMRKLWADTGLWQTTAKVQTPFTAWLNNNLYTVKYPSSRVSINKKVYSIYVGDNKFGVLDLGYWDINSYKAKGINTGDFYVRPADAVTPMGTISDVYRTAEGKIILIKVKLTHSKLYHTANNSLTNREVWLKPSRLTDIPYNPNLKGLMGTSPSQLLSNVL